MTRKLSLVTGILIAAGAFVAVLLLGSVVNPSPYHVVVAITDIQPGVALDKSLIGVDAQVVSPQVAKEYVLAEDLDQYIGATIVRELVPGQPLMHRDLVRSDNPAAQRRLALALEDPNQVAMVISVGKENTPDGIVPGDKIAIVWSVGEASSYMVGPVGNTPLTGSGVGIPGGEILPPETGGASGERNQTPEVSKIPGGENLPPELAALLGYTTTQSASEITLPLAKTLVNVAEVIRVRRERIANPAYTGEKGESPYVEGDIIGLEVVVPREEMEAVQFAITNGKYSIVVLSPNADPREVAKEASLGVMWQDVLVYFQVSRLQALGFLTVTEAIRPAGATDLYGAVLYPAPLFGAPGGVLDSGQSGTIMVPGLPETMTLPLGSEGGETSRGEETEKPAVAEEPLPTATPAGGPEAGAGSSEGAASSGEESTKPGEGPVPSLSSATGSLVAGIGCLAVVILIIAVAIMLTVRTLRKQRS